MAEEGGGMWKDQHHVELSVGCEGRATVTCQHCSCHGKGKDDVEASKKQGSADLSALPYLFVCIFVPQGDCHPRIRENMKELLIYWESPES